MPEERTRTTRTITTKIELSSEEVIDLIRKRFDPSGTAEIEIDCGEGYGCYFGGATITSTITEESSDDPRL